VVWWQQRRLVVWKQQWFKRIKDLVDHCEPDFLYSDGSLPFEYYGYNLVAHLYNISARKHGGKTEAVYFSKRPEDAEQGICVLDHERSVIDTIAPRPWQTDTCIGQWHYKRGIKYKSAKKVIDLLVDIVSKNGNLLLNFPLPNSGELDPDELVTLAGITSWMQVNSEGIYDTRPWKIYGEGPSTRLAIPKNGKEFDPNEGKKPDLTAADVRFTAKGSTIYAFVQGWPNGTVLLQALGSRSPHATRITQVRILGHDQNLKYTQQTDGLRITLPSRRAATADTGFTLKLTTA